MTGHVTDHLSAGRHTWGVFIFPNGNELSAGTGREGDGVGVGGVAAGRVDRPDRVFAILSELYMPYEPVLLARIDKPDSHKLEGYRADGGYATVERVLKERSRRRRHAGQGLRPPRPRRGGVPLRAQVDVPAEGPPRPDLPVRQRRRVRAVYVQQPHPDGEGPPPGARRDHAGVLRHQVARRRSSTSATSTATPSARCKRRSTSCTPPGCSARTSSAAGSTSTSCCTAGPGRTSAARRPG